jgi:hypothetical protein
MLVHSILDCARAAVVYPLIAVVLRSDSWWARIGMFVVVVVWSFAMFFFGIMHGSIQIGVSRGHASAPSGSGSSRAATPEYSIQAIRYASAEDEVAGLVMGARL